MNISTQISEKESFSISAIRNIATFLIVLCHICSESQRFAFFGQVFNVGIYVFFALSGFIYARKEIENKYRWLVKRFFRLAIPCYVYYVISYLILACLGKTEPLGLWNVIIVVTNLQGFIPCGLGGVVISHLWFLSHIMFCYLLTPLFEKVKKTHNTWLNAGVALSIIALQMVTSVKLGGNYVHFAGVLLYYLFYLYSTDKNINAQSRKNNILVCILGVCAVLIRMLFIVTGLDEQVQLIYDILIVPYSQLLLGVMIFTLLYLAIDRIYTWITQHARLSNCVRRISEYSMDIYIVHYMAMVGSFSTILKSVAQNSLLYYVALSVVFCVVYAAVIHNFSGWIHKHI